jgi:hypothetical protein
LIDENEHFGGIWLPRSSRWKSRPCRKKINARCSEPAFNISQFNIFFLPFSTLKMEASGSSEMLIASRTQHHVPEDSNFESLPWEPEMSHNGLIIRKLIVNIMLLAIPISHCTSCFSAVNDSNMAAMCLRCGGTGTI